MKFRHRWNIWIIEL